MIIRDGCTFWSLTKDLFALGDPTRGIKPQTTELLVLLRNPFTTIRWQPRKVDKVVAQEG